MSAYDYMLRRLWPICKGEGVLAWRVAVFAESTAYAPCDLIDAAVDIAWERVRPVSLDGMDLCAEVRGDLLYLSFPPARIDLP